MILKKLIVTQQRYTHKLILRYSSCLELPKLHCGDSVGKDNSGVFSVIQLHYLPSARAHG